MAQDLPSQVDTEIAKEQSQPINIIELSLDAGTIRYAATRSDFVFPTGGNTYTAKALQIATIQQTKEGQIVRVEFAFDNIAADMHAYNVAEKFDGKVIQWKKIWRDAIGVSTYYRLMFYGYMEEPHEINKRWLRVNGVMGKSLQRRVLQKYYRRECNHNFGDGKCNYEGYSNLVSLKATGTADSGSTSTLVDNALTQADDYWNFGRIEITISGTKYYRKVKDFAAGSDTVTFDVALPVAVSSGDVYAVYKGCSKTWDACQSNNSYGPSSDNKANFQGFIHIGDKEEPA